MNKIYSLNEAVMNGTVTMGMSQMAFEDMESAEWVKNMMEKFGTSDMFGVNRSISEISIVNSEGNLIEVPGIKYKFREIFGNLPYKIFDKKRQKSLTLSLIHIGEGWFELRYCGPNGTMVAGRKISRNVDDVVKQMEAFYEGQKDHVFEVVEYDPAKV